MPETATAPPQAATEETKPTPTAEEAAAAALMTKTPPSEASPETKPPETKPPATETKPEGKPGETKPEVKAPVTYDLKLPEGSLLDKSDIERITKIAKDNEFAPEDAQALLEAEHEAVKSYADKQTAALAQAPTQWADQAKSDKEIGGENLPAAAELGARVLKKFASPSLIATLGLKTDKNPNGTGLGNHPELIRLMYRIGKAIGDDQLVVGSAGATPPTKSKADQLFPTSASKEG